MPSTMHEALVGMFRSRPALAAELLAGVLGVDVPEYDSARLDDPEVADLPVTQYRADAVVVLSFEGDPVLAVVVEVQLARDPDKRWSWPVYVATLRARLRCPVDLLVLCADRRLSRWCATPIELGPSGSRVVPTVLSPERVPAVTDPSLARGDPEVAVLSALAHGGSRRDVLDVLREALANVDRDHAILYLRLVCAALPAAARHYLEGSMAVDLEDYEPDFREWIESFGLSKGEAKGEARSILAVLDARGVPVTDEIRDRITRCRDIAQLDVWLRRAVTVGSADELFD